MRRSTIDEVVKAEDGHKMHRKHKSKTLKNKKFFLRLL
jgi:hypothetical protein